MLRLTSVLVAVLFVCLAVFGAGEEKRAGLLRAETTGPDTAPPTTTQEQVARVPASTAQATDHSVGFTSSAATSPSFVATPASYTVTAPEPRPEPLALPVIETTNLADQPDEATGALPVSPLAVALAGATDGLAEAVEAPAEIWTVTASRVNVRQGPSTIYPVMAKLTRGETPELVEMTDDGWAFIRLENGGRGYMAAKFLKRTTPQG